MKLKAIITSIFIILLLTSCWKAELVSYDFNDQNLMRSYEAPDRSLNLWSKHIRGFVNMNLYLTWTEVNNIYMQNNYIEIIDISWYKKLWRIDLSNNLLYFWWDIKLPSDIRHINLSNNKLTSLDWLSGLKKLKTLDLSNNALDDDDIKWLKWLNKLEYINVKWNNVSQKILDKFDKFNEKYLSTHEMPYVKQ